MFPACMKQPAFLPTMPALSVRKAVPKTYGRVVRSFKAFPNDTHKNNSGAGGSGFLLVCAVLKRGVALF